MRELGRSSKKKSGPISVPLEHARWRHFGWATFCMVLGGVLLLKLGTIGQGFGLVLIALATYRAYRFAKTLLLPAGTIEITASHIELPLGLCNGKSDRVAIDEVSHVFFLRRAVSWTTSGPVLVIEVGGRAYTFPRDWFESETDQRKVLQRLLEHQKSEQRKDETTSAEQASGAQTNGSKAGTKVSGPEADADAERADDDADAEQKTAQSSASGA